MIKQTILIMVQIGNSLDKDCVHLYTVVLTSDCYLCFKHKYNSAL